MKKTLLLMMIMLSIVLMVGCTSTLPETQTIDIIEQNLSITYASGDNQSHVTQNITLPYTATSYAEATIQWESDQPDIISHNGLVTRDTDDHDVILSYVISYQGDIRIGSLTLTVIADRPTLEEIAAEIDILYASGDYAESVTQNLTLPTTSLLDEEILITWSSMDTSVISHQGVVTRGDEDQSVFMKYTILYKNETKVGYVVVNVIAEDVYYTITFHSNGGTTVDDMIELQNTIIEAPENPTRDGYTFIAWYIDQAFTTSYVFGTPLVSDVTLYARWQADFNDDFTGIYDGAEGLTGSSLITFLNQIVTSGIVGNEQDYGDARYTLDNTDQDPNNSNHIILVYRGTSVDSNWDYGVTWNREHVWPQSLLGVDASNNTVNMASDLHNLKPANPQENSTRSNKWFGPESTYYAYEPRDEVKGDIARIIFYMAVRYYTQLSLVNLSGSQEPSIYQMGDLATLLLWHDLDPVDAFEIHRNDLIESYQGNRNPFIDYPVFADLIWN